MSTPASPNTVTPASAPADLAAGERNRRAAPAGSGPGTPRARGALGTAAGRAAVGLLVPVLLVALWWAVTEAGLFSPVQLPSPASVVQAGVQLAADGPLWHHIAISVQRVLIGFAIGGVLGLLVGSVLGLSRWADALFSPLTGAIRAVPSLAWVPLLILWMGIGEDSKITLIAIGAFFPIFTNVYSALKHVDPHLVEAGRAFGYHGLRLLRTVQLPAVIPSVFSGLRLALAQAWLFLVAAELIASSMGLGFLLTDSQNNGRTDRLILAIVLLAVIGKVTDAVLGLVEKWAVRRWS
ncbi:MULTISPECIES: ABC transporter permease [Micrococcaceae]|uniref:ABC transporter permease n=1 Tax=Micrococcaceae TaxID=1268 RepID=UPI00161B94AF|nr:ABC transporter permease [Citricoccus sp.]MBB5750471.1 sulfonate transport system permease protein [Micrococcus sp. TA1]HRO28923.1 ABC transporter permease [Citricoccus sp.]HRO94989.1 ABC transporter permease [Citricoccus sp.]